MYVLIRFSLRLPLGLMVGVLLAGSACSRDVHERGDRRDADTPVEVSDAVMVDPAPVQVAVPGVWPAATFGADQYLVVWEDQRTRRPILYGARVALDGTSRDPHGFPIFDADFEAGSTHAFQPVVAFDGDNFLVVSNVAGQILGARVSPAGEVLDPAGIVIASSASLTSPPSLLFDGQQYRVAWSVARRPVGSEDGIYSARVKPDGTVVDRDGVRAHEYSRYSPVSVGVSFDGIHSLLSWPRRWAVEGVRIATDGRPIDRTPISFATDEEIQSTVAGFDGSNHVIAWFGYGAPDDSEPTPRFMALRVSPTGTVLDPEGIVLDEGGDFWNMVRLDMVAGDGRSVVLWTTSSNYLRAEPIRMVELAADGTTHVHPADARRDGLEATLATSPDGGLLLWRQGESPASAHTPLVGTRLDATGTPLLDSVVTPAAITNEQRLIAAAAGEQEFFAVWTDTRYPSGEGPALAGARVARDGSSLDATPMQFTDFATDRAAVVFDGKNYVVAWSDEDARVQIERVSTAGERLGVVAPEPPLYSLSDFLAAASDGTHTLLIGTLDWPNLVGALLLDQSGAVVGDPIHVHDDADEVAHHASVGFDGSNYLVVWHDENVVFGRRISQAGALEGQRFVIVEDEGIGHVAVASGAGNHLVTWETYENLRATRVGPDGQLHEVEEPLDGDRVDWCCGSSVAFDGQSFIVVWRGLAEKWEDDFFYEELNSNLYEYVLYGTRVSLEGEVSQPFLISPPDFGEEDQKLAVSSDGQTLVLYSSLVPEPPYEARRLLARRVTQ